MTTNDIDLLAFDLSDDTDRLVLADLLADAGRAFEEKILRDDTCGTLWVKDCRIVKAIEVAKLDALQSEGGSDPRSGGRPFGYVPGWFVIWDHDGEGSLAFDLEADEEYHVHADAGQPALDEDEAAQIVTAAVRRMGGREVARIANCIERSLEA